MTAGELKALLALVPDDATILTGRQFDGPCHIQLVHKSGSRAKPGSVTVVLDGAINWRAATPTVVLTGRWPAVPQKRRAVNTEQIRNELLDMLRDSA